jgi:dihydrofolate synthase/folylpolyglutamate synthase
MAEPAFSKAEQVIDELMGLHPKGFDLSLERIRRLLEVLGNPQHRLPPVIHVAGTNGKGSVTAFCRALLEAQGLSVHVHTSPHLVRWHERYHRRQGWIVKFVMTTSLPACVSGASPTPTAASRSRLRDSTAATFLLFPSIRQTWRSSRLVSAAVSTPPS